jgi:hypothetical protein
LILNQKQLPFLHLIFQEFVTFQNPKSQYQQISTNQLMFQINSTKSIDFNVSICCHHSVCWVIFGMCLILVIVNKKKKSWNRTKYRYFGISTCCE